METRPLGRTGQESTVLTFGAIALDPLPQDEADELTERVLDAGVNHIDVAPRYGTAEVKLRPTLAERRDEVFLGCKTKKRTREEAADQLEESLDRMGVDHIDLYQFHAVTTEEAVDEICGPGGALEAVHEAREEGTIDHIGVTSHGSPDVVLDAMDRIDPDTVMFPMNFALLGRGDDRHDFRRVLDRAREEGVGTIGIKAFAKGPWPPESELPEEERPYETWYEPFDTQAEIDDCLNFALSQGLTSITNAGDPRLVPMILDAAERYRELSDEEQAELMEHGRRMETPVPKR